MRVLLTGASGFLGANCLRHLLDNTDWHIVCPASFRHRGVPERITMTVQDDEWERVTVVHCDLAAPIADTSALLFGHIDHIINFASESHIPRSLADPVPFVRNNIDLMMSLLEYARTISALRSFVQISTDEVYGPVAHGAHREWDPILPSTPYSASKAAQEALGISYWRSFDVPLVLVNTMNPIGPMQDPEKFVPLLMGRVTAGDVVSIHADPDGTVGSRVYVNVRDLADAVLHLIGWAPPHLYSDGAQRPDRWNVVGERDVSNLELAQLIARAMGRPLRHELVVSDRPGHGLRYALDGDKTANETGWLPKSRIEDTVVELVEWSHRNPFWRQRTARSS